MQLTGQGMALQVEVRLVGPQALPLKRGARRILRVLMALPPPQDLVHLERVDHLEVSQSTGQSTTLQVLDFLRLPHFLPRPWWSAMIIRQEVLRPAPQVLEQSDQADHLEVLQSTSLEGM